MILGPRSRAGFHPACVIGANSAISTATVNPMKNGASVPGRALLRASVSARIMNISTPVPSASTLTAASGETSACAAASVPKIAGFGKYSPNTIAESSDPAAPRSR